jgi:hypothetical protein
LVAADDIAADQHAQRFHSAADRTDHRARTRHVRRWDYLANLLQVVIETILFYHPIVHWISRDVREGA